MSACLGPKLKVPKVLLRYLGALVSSGQQDWIKNYLTAEIPGFEVDDALSSQSRLNFPSAGIGRSASA